MFNNIFSFSTYYCYKEEENMRDDIIVDSKINDAVRTKINDYSEFIASLQSILELTQNYGNNLNKLLSDIQDIQEKYQ